MDQDTGRGVEHGRSDYGDSLLKEVAGGEDLLFPSPRIGERLGGEDGSRFEILEKLGRGAMGLVFQARDHELLRTVALKFLVPHGGFGEAPLTSLLRQEARAIAQLDHDAIIRVFDVSEWGSPRYKNRVPFLVMEYLEGESLASLLRRERLGLDRAMALMGGILGGLAHAHERHVIHRDLKPSNVFVLKNDKVKLLDFGLAHLSARAAVPYMAAAGTPTHMAPEQWRGEAQDERTDVWAVGVTFFEMLTGAHPYPEANSLELRAIMRSDEPMPSVRERCPELPEEVDRLVARALAKDPARRFPSAVELREELRALEERFVPRPGAARLVSPQRRQVTVVACRLANLAEPLDPEDFSELEAAFHRECSSLVHQHGGSVSLCVGDEVLACFGVPAAREDDSERAVRAGLRMTTSLHEELSRLTRGKLAVRVGIHTDQVVVEGLVPELQGATFSIQGEAPEIAAWLAKQAGPDAVLISEPTSRLVRGAFETQDLGPHPFEGLSGRASLGVHRVVRPRTVATRFERALAVGELTPLVGRTRELKLLLDLWAQAVRGRSTFLLIEGDAGMGKSRLVRELRERVPLASVSWVKCQCWSQYSNSAFYPVLDRLQYYMKLSPEDSSQQRLRKLEAQLGGLGLSGEHVRSIESFLSLPVPRDSGSLQLTPERQRERIFEALTALLLQGAETRPVIFAVEDVHWADHSTLQLLGFLLDRIERTNCLVLLTTRPGFQPPWPSRPWSHRLVLDRLSAEQTAALVKEAAHGEVLSDETVGQLVARTDGIPLFVEEMTRMVVERAGPGRTKSPIPLTLNELLLARLDLLPPRRRALAQLCAVVGRSFSHALLAELSGRDGATLQEDLEGLIDAGLLQRQGEADEPAYQFRHALIRDAAYQSLLRSTRRQHHRRIARVLAERFPESVENRPELLAHHCTEAGDLELAIGYWARAGELASQRSAYVEAVEHLNLALRLLRSLPDSPKHKGWELQLLNAIGIPLRETRGIGCPEVAQTYGRARDLIREVGELLPELDLSSWGFFSYHFARAMFPLAREPAELLVALGERLRRPGLLSLGHRMLATVLFTDGKVAPSLRHIEQALAYSSFDIGLQRDLAVKHWVAPGVAALAYAPVIRSVFGDPVRAWQDSQDALRLAERIGHPHTSGFALTYAIVACQLRREARRVLELADRDIALSREHRFGLWLRWATLLRSWAVAELGNPEEGLKTMREGLGQWLASGMRAGLPHFLGMRAEMHLKLGQVPEALASVEEGLAWAEERKELSFVVELYRLKGECLRLLGREGEARESFVHAIEVAREQGAGTFGLRATASLGRQLLDLGEPQAARRMLEGSRARFGAGLETPEFREAEALLARASEEGPRPPA